MLKTSLYSQTNIVIEMIPGITEYTMPPEFCDALLNDDTDICITTNGSVRARITVIVEGCIIDLENKTLQIPNLIDLQINDPITMSGKSTLKGDNISGSRIIFTGSRDESAVVLDNCQNCDIKDLEIQGTGNETGILITEGSNNNDINDIAMKELRYGIIIRGDNNDFSDLDFYIVAADPDNCVALTDDGVAIWLSRADDNNLRNAVHTRSPGAITLRVDDDCHNNIMESISVEQERPVGETHCDPSLFFNITAADQVTGNYFLTNLNVVNNGLAGNNICQFCINNTSNTLHQAAIANYCGNNIMTCEGANNTICR